MVAIDQFVEDDHDRLFWEIGERPAAPNPAQYTRRRAGLYHRKSHHTEGKSKSVVEQEKDNRRNCDRFGLDVSPDRIYTEAEGCKGDWPPGCQPGPYRPQLARLIEDIIQGKV